MRNSLILLKSYFLLFSVILLINILCRQLLYFFNPELFKISLSQYALYALYGIRFDVSSVAYAGMLFTMLLFIPNPFLHRKFFRIVLFWAGLLPNILIIAPSIADAFYYPFIFRRSTYDLVFILFTMKGEMDTLWKDLILDFWPAYLIFAACIVFLVFAFRKFMKHIPAMYRSANQYITGIIVFLLMAGLTVLAARGGFQKKPVSLVTAGMYAPPGHTPLVLNSAFSIIRTWGKTGLEKKHYFADSDSLFLYFNPCKHGSDSAFQQKNVVIIILESFSNEHLNSVHPDQQIDKTKNFAPFLDSLIHEGIFCPNTFANGKRSVEGIPAVVSSVPTLMNTPYILSPYINNNLPGLPTLLAQEGYYSIFFHGGQNGTMNFDAYAKTAGFHEYSGKNEYPDDADFDGKWGIKDEPYLQFVVNKLSQIHEPFFATVFTLSSHHPYLVPDEYKSILPQGPLPIHQTIAYTDMALKKFFLTASNQEWYNNTLFVITSDHSSEPYLDFYHEAAGMYSVPLLFYDPGSQQKGKVNRTCQQTDIMPSVLDYLDYSLPYTAFGNSIFDSLQTGFAVAWTGNGYQLISGEHILIMIDDKAVKVWNYFNDPTGKVSENNDQMITSELFHLLRAYIQCYNNSLIDNKILCP